MNILLNEFQLEMPGGATYLPYASGLLAAYALKHCQRRNDLTFRWGNTSWPYWDAVGFSVSQWNLNRSLNSAKGFTEPIKGKKIPTIVFGGPSAIEVKDYPIILGEGERAFSIGLDTGLFVSTISQVSDLDDIPSPYTTGLFNSLVTSQSQAIIETVRGCPFGCAYCAWGKGSTRVRMHSLEYVKEEAEWMGVNKIKYVFCADGNFGMFPRDVKVAKIYADVKKKYGYPERFRVCFGKNAEESIFETASILAKAGLVKSVTLSRQSTHPLALASVGRANVSQKTFDNLQDRYAKAGIPTYSELILGLPGETYESWKQGILDSMRQKTQLFLYPCSVLPGTRMADLDYRVLHGIRTKRVLLTPVHCVPPVVDEFEDLVVETNSMDAEDWKRAMVLGWLVQLFYSFGLMDGTPEEIIAAAEKPNPETDYFDQVANRMLRGKGRCEVDTQFGETYWEPEEIAYLEIKGISGADEAVRALMHARKSGMKK